MSPKGHFSSPYHAPLQTRQASSSVLGEPLPCLSAVTGPSPKEDETGHSQAIKGHPIQGARRIPGHEGQLWPSASQLHCASQTCMCSARCTAVFPVSTSYADKLDLFLAGLDKSRPFQCGLRMVKSELGRYQWFRFEGGGTGPYHALQLYK